MDDKVEKAMKDLDEISEQFNRVMDEIRDEREQYWNSLSKDEQLKCFCAVVERIMQAENEGHSYRGILYHVFEFGPEAYARAQLSGFLELHNNIYNKDQEQRLLEAFAFHCGVKDPKQMIKEFYGNL